MSRWLLLLTLLTGCDTARTFSLPFVARVGDADFSCEATYEGIGTGGSTLAFLDARLFVHDVVFLDADGEPLPTELDEDGAFQSRGVALVDFEDDEGSCTTGSPETHTAITGVVRGTPAGLSFKVGVPSELNHLDAATAEPPLNAPGMWWSWAGGFKYARIDAVTTGNPAYYFHLGATDCSGTPGSGFSCDYGNVAEITLDAFDLENDAVVVDLAAIYAGVDVDAEPEGQDVPGCMAFAGDPECAPMMGAFGLGFMDLPAPADQTVFSRGTP